MNAATALPVLAALCCGTAFAASDTPLFDHARELPFVAVVSNDNGLRRIRYEIEKNPPPETGCARTLGAKRFAEMFETLAGEQAGRGDPASALESLAKSLACNPRVARVHSAQASALMKMSRFEEARAAIQRARAIDTDDHLASVVTMQMAFIEERWPEATAELRSLIRNSSDEEQTTFWECFLWLAQRRSGVPEPEDSAAELTEEWPRPVLEMLRGALDESDVLSVVEDADSDAQERLRLAEALYYTGQARLASGDVENARFYFAAAVNLKAMFYIEHTMALAELEKLRALAP